MTIEGADATLASNYAAFASEAYRQGIPPDVDRAARLQLIDSVGVALAARQESTVEAVHDLVDRWGGRGPAHTFGARDLPTAHAALIGGTMAHALDFDDTHGPSVLHPSASVVHAAIAAATEHGSTIDQLVRAIALGNELVVRLGMAGVEIGKDSIYFERGFHATSICGAIGSALSASLLGGLDAAMVQHAIAVASSFSSGLLESNRTGGTVKRIHCGWAAFSGVTARDLAMLGVTGAPTVFEGRFGLLHAFCGDRAELSWLSRDLGDHWEMRRIGFKPYPTNGFLTSMVDATLELRARGCRIHDIEHAVVGLPAPVLRTVAEPRDVKIRPTTIYGARFSAPFVFALALRGGGGLGLALDDLSGDAIDDPELLDLAARVDVVADPDCTNAFPGDVLANVEVHLRSGEVLTERRTKRRGGVNAPLAAEEVHVKYTANASRLVHADQADAALGLMSTPDTDATVEELLDLLAPTTR